MYDVIKLYIVTPFFKSCSFENPHVMLQNNLAKEGNY